MTERSSFAPLVTGVLLICAFGQALRNYTAVNVPQENEQASNTSSIRYISLAERLEAIDRRTYNFTNGIPGAAAAPVSFAENLSKFRKSSFSAVK